MRGSGEGEGEGEEEGVVTQGSGDLCVCVIVLRCHKHFCLRVLCTRLRRTVIFSLECSLPSTSVGGWEEDTEAALESLRKKAFGGLAEVRSAYCCVLSTGGKSLLELGKEPWVKLGQPLATTVASGCSSTSGSQSIYCMASGRQGVLVDSG